MVSSQNSVRWKWIASLLFPIVVIGLLEIGARSWKSFRADPIKNPPPIPAELMNWQKFAIPLEKLPHANAYKNYPWVKDFMEEDAKYHGGGLVYEPFSLWKHLPIKTKYITYDVSGYRVTVHPPKKSFRRKFQVFMFGGSTLAGDGIFRDQDLIPSQLAHLINKKNNDTFYEFHNYAQSGFNQGNEVILLVRLLSQGARPDLVIFYDGVNDSLQRVGFGEPHMAYSSFVSAPKLGSMRDIFRRWFINWLRRKSAMLELLLPAVPDPRPPSQFTTDPKLMQGRAEQLSDFYFGNMDLVEKLSKGYGFKYVLILQPTLFTQSKRSKEEQELFHKVEAIAPSIQKVFDVSYPMLRKRFSEGKSPNFVDFSSVYGNVDISIYSDFMHCSPKGNEIIAREIADIMEARWSGKFLKLE